MNNTNDARPGDRVVIVILHFSKRKPELQRHYCNLLQLWMTLCNLLQFWLQH